MKLAILKLKKKSIRNLSKEILLLVVLSLLSVNTVHSQVTIGSAIPPNNGSLLELKEISPDENNSNSTKAFILPRVFIKDESILQIDDDNKSKEYEGAQVYNTNDNLGIGVMTWVKGKWTSFIYSIGKRQNTELVSFKQTTDRDQIKLQKNSDTEISSLAVDYLAPQDGMIYITTVMYCKMLRPSSGKTDLGNTFFKIVIRDLNDNRTANFIAACTPISAEGEDQYANSNPTSASSISSFVVNKDHKYTIRVYGQEGWAESNQVIAGTYSWQTYKAYSAIKVDFISTPY